MILIVDDARAYPHQLLIASACTLEVIRIEIAETEYWKHWSIFFACLQNGLQDTDSHWVIALFDIWIYLFSNADGIWAPLGR